MTKTGNNIKVGIIGIGNMGTFHAKKIYEGAIRGLKLTAISDIRDERRAWAKVTFGKDVAIFNDGEALIASGKVDAIIVATPHHDHPRLAILGFEQGLHVLIEKPAGSNTLEVRRMNEAAQKSENQFAIVYNQRNNPLYRKLRELIQAGELGEIRRMNWIITNWYRSQDYYNSGGWRATWAGEGGGVLLNQCPHQLDLWQWTTGMMPTRVRAFCSFGKYRDIEVEDDVTAYAEYENGATGVFITTTGEAPGTNRFEVSGDNGKVLIEDGKLTFYRLRVPEPEFNKTAVGFASPECWKIDIPIQGKSTEHIGILENFSDAIHTGAPLTAPGEEGINGLSLSNAMLLSTWTDNWVDFPLDDIAYAQALQKRIDSSAQKADASGVLDITGSNSKV